jgi:transposase
MWYVGLDLHWRTSSVCILDQQGREVKKTTLKGDWEQVLQWLDREVVGPYEICYEASCGYGVMYDKLLRRASRVVVAHPGKLRLIFACKRKNDRLDAAKLAMLLRAGLISQVYVPSADVRQWRQMINMRRELVAKRTRTKNQIRALLKSNGLRSPYRLWNSKGRQWLLEAAGWPDEGSKMQIMLLVHELQMYDKQIGLVSRALNERGRKDPRVVLLQTVPGVGPRTAEAVVAYIDEAGRFRSGSQVGSYFGLVPRQDQSGRVNRLGHVTKEGPSVVRQLVVEAAWQAIRHSATVRARFERLGGLEPDRRKTALVAVGRWLLCCMHSMLVSGEVWRETAASTCAAA